MSRCGAAMLMPSSTLAEAKVTEIGALFCSVPLGWYDVLSMTAYFIAHIPKHGASPKTSL
eukprot:8324030-Pyramimonas_sp.AAC.1